jgi:hypothetical protein
MSIKKYRDADNDGRADSSLSMSEIKVEHGGDSDPSLKEYYRNERFVQSGDFDVGFNDSYTAGGYAIKDPDDPNNKMIVRISVKGGSLVIGTLNIQPGGKGIITDPATQTEREVVIEAVHVEGTGDATTGEYRLKTRDTENAFIPETGQPISFSDLYGTKKETDGYSFDASIGKLYITVTKNNNLSNMVSGDNDFLLDTPEFTIDKNKFIPLVTAKSLLERSGIYQDRPQDVNHIEFFIPQDTIVYSPDSARPAFDIDGIPSRISILLNLAGRIVGGGGDGGDASYDATSSFRTGKDGSTGLRVNHDGKFRLNVTSDSDYAICGGGGGGAGGYFRFSDGKVVGAGGGGGAGRSLGGAARHDVEIYDKKAASWMPSNDNQLLYNAGTSDIYGPSGVTNLMKYFNYPSWLGRLEDPEDLLARLEGINSRYADISINASKNPNRKLLRSNSGRATLTNYREIQNVVRAEQLHGGAGAGGTMIWKTCPQRHPVVLPYTKPDYINEQDASLNGDAPEFMHQVPAGFTNGWIIEHIHGSSGGYYSIVENGKCIYSDYAREIRNLKGIGFEAQDNYGVHSTRQHIRVATVHKTNDGQLADDDARIHTHWLTYERVDFTDDGAPPYTENQSNFFDDPQQAGGGVFRAGNGNPSNPPYYHGGGFTRSNNTSSSGDVHKYLYYPVKKWDYGISKMYFPLDYNDANNDGNSGSTIIANTWPNGQFSGVTVGTGANGSVKGNPGNFNLSYRNAIRRDYKDYFDSNKDRRMHLNTTDVSIGGYGGCGKSPRGGDAGVAYSYYHPPEAGFLNQRYQTIYGGGGGGGDFGANGGDAVGIHFVGTNFSTVEAYKAYGGRGGLAIEVNKAEHLLTDGGVSSVPLNKTHGRIAIAGQTDAYAGVMVVGYNTFQFTNDPKTRFEAGYGAFSFAPTTPGGHGGAVESPYGELPNRDQIDAGNGNETIVHIKAEGYTDGSDMTLTFELWGTNDTNHLYNGGWENLLIDGITFKRSDATFSGFNVLFPGRRWIWNLTSNPFGTSRGAVKTISIG